MSIINSPFSYGSNPGKRVIIGRRINFNDE
jgi:hypothetical protein